MHKIQIMITFYSTVVIALLSIQVFAVPSVEMIDFIVEPNEDKVEIRWSTSSETNNDYFVVERSVDLEKTIELVKVNGAGNTSNTNEYHFVDDAPLEGTAFYRIKQVDIDGSITYSDWQGVNYEPRMSRLDIKVYPNPNNGNAPVVINAFGLQPESNVTVSMFDLGGRKMLSEVAQTDMLGDLFYVISAGNIIKSGTYVVTVIQDDRKMIKKIVVQ